MEKKIRISARVSGTTKAMLERNARASGVKKGRLVEDALRHHLLAFAELPAPRLPEPQVKEGIQTR